MALGATQGTLSDEFVDIDKALDVIEDRLAFTVDQAELGDAMCAAVELGHRVDALQARLGLACTINKVAAVNGLRTIGQYVAERSNSRAVDVDRLTKTARWLRDYPIFEAAFGNELTAAHVKTLRKLDTNYEVGNKLRGDQQFFVDTAAACSFAGFEQACGYWLSRVDPDGKEPLDQIEKSSFRVGTGSGGRGELSGVCDAVTAQTIRTAVEHEAEKIRKADKKAGISRTQAQRNMAALKALVTRGFARPDGSFPVPLVNIVISQKVAEWAINTLSGAIEPGDTVPVHPTDVDGRCELIDGTPIHPFLAVHALGLVGPDGAADPVILRRYVMNAESRLLDVSVNSRFFPEWMRTAAFVQSRGKCETGGCDAPFSWHQIDHIHPVHHGGETRFDNAGTKCAPDNQAKGATITDTRWANRTPPPRRTRRTRQPNNNGDDDPATTEPF